MAKQTINRTPKQVNVSNLNEQYYNTTQFKGLCTNKNYVSIDQETFEDCNNVYVTQDNELSTRPPLKRITYLPPGSIVKEIFKINNLIIYHTFDTEANLYYINFEYNEKWYSRPVFNHIKIIWLNTRFIVFCKDDTTAELKYDMIGFDYNYDLQDFNWYNLDQLIYIPVKEIIRGGIKTSGESLNIFTTSYVIEYIFEYGKANNSLLLNGKDVEIRIGEDVINIIFNVDTEKVLMRKMGTIVVDTIQVSNKKTYIATNGSSSSYFFSLDGVVFHEILPPNDFIFDRPEEWTTGAFSDDGSALHVCPTGYTRLYTMRFDIRTPEDIQGLVWTYKVFTLPELGGYNFWASRESAAGTYLMSSTKVNSYAARPFSFYSFGHSPSGDFAAFLTGITILSSNWTYTGNIFQEESGLTYRRNEYIAMLVIKNGDNIKTYPIEFGNYGNSEVIILNQKSNKLRFCVTSSLGSKIAVTFPWYESVRGKQLMFTYTIKTNNDFVPYYNFDSRPRSLQSTYFFTLYKNYTFKQNISVITGIEDCHGGNIENYYNIDVSLLFSDSLGFVLTVAYMNLSGDCLARLEEIDKLLPDYQTQFYTDKYIYPSTVVSNPDGTRGKYPLTFSRYETFRRNVSFDISRPRYYKLNNFFISNDLLTNRYYRYRETNIPLITDDITLYPIYINNANIGYYNTGNNVIYDNEYDTAYVRYVEKGEYKLMLPDLDYNFINNVITKDNKIYSSVKKDGKVYFPENEKLEFEGDVTALIMFAENILGVFLEDIVYELNYRENDVLGYIKSLSPTKLKLGCKKGSDVLLNYDGKTIFTTNLKGLSALSYQDFVQSTGMVYSYLTDNMITLYNKYADGEIKLNQYKDWIIMYRQDRNYFYLFDMRTKSWWKWTNINNIRQIVSNDDKLEMLSTSGNVFYYNFDDEKFFDDDVNIIPWSFTSQKLHFEAPNNYKHIRSLSVITTNNSKKLRYNLKFKNYRNLNNTFDFDVVEHKIKDLATVIERVNFIKTNAFQYTLSNDETDDGGNSFSTSDIAIKYRVTERVR